VSFTNPNDRAAPRHLLGFAGLTPTYRLWHKPEKKSETPKTGGGKVQAGWGEFHEPQRSRSAYNLLGFAGLTPTYRLFSRQALWHKPEKKGETPKTGGGKGMENNKVSPEKLPDLSDEMQRE